MGIVASVTKRIFHFNFEARTSRGAMTERVSWFLSVWDERDATVTGIGECGPLTGLSLESSDEIEPALHQLIVRLNREKSSAPSLLERRHQLVSARHPSILFALETALLDLHHGGRKIIFDNDFVRGQPIDINGLIWMGDKNFMIQQIEDKIRQGFYCLKLKIGGIDFDEECHILEGVRETFGGSVTLRLDANGSFPDAAALHRLERLSRFDIHSIEQPLRVGSPLLKTICRESPIPVALDEELIACTNRDDRVRLLDAVEPRYIILKPTLHGGIAGCDAWIANARERNIGWWLTSALESAIGLNAICQYAAGYKPALPQGLGTGAIYRDNIASPLNVSDGAIRYDSSQPWEKFID